jgi:ORF6N domain
MASAKSPSPLQDIAGVIIVLRGHRVLLDSDIAVLYGVATKALLQAVKRNLERFPPDFMIQLTGEEWASLRSQIVTSNPPRGGRRYSPYAFTEQGVAMLSSVLTSRRAIAVNIQIMRTFIQLRECSVPTKIWRADLRSSKLGSIKNSASTMRPSPPSSPPSDSS